MTDYCNSIETRSCKFDEAESRARCGAAATLRFSSQGGKITSQGVAYNYQKAMLPVLITAGVEKLSAVPGATQTGTTATSTSSGGSTSSTAASYSLTPAGPTSTTKAAKDNSGNSLVRSCRCLWRRSCPLLRRPNRQLILNDIAFTKNRRLSSSRVYCISMLILLEEVSLANNR